MSFPSPTVTPPTFTSWPSAYFQGITFSGYGPFYLRGDDEFDGIFNVETVGTDPVAPRVPGTYVGLKLPGERVITLSTDIGPPYGSYASLAGAQAALRSALTPSFTTEYPFFFQLSQSGVMYASMARAVKRDGKVDLAYTLGGLAQKVPVQFIASDPVLYAAGTQDATVGVPGPLGGFKFNMTFPLSFGGGTTAGIIDAANNGDMPCYPVVTFTGPCTSPKLTNTTLSGNPFIQFNLTMAAGDQLVVVFDPKYPSATYYNSGTSAGSPAMYALAQGSTWWAIAPGETNVLEFTTLDTSAVAGSCTVEYASAYSAAA